MKRTSSKSTFDHLVAESKQITADLIALRRDAAKLTQLNRGVLAEQTLRMIADRAYLTSTAIRALAQTVSDVWMDAAGLRDKEEDNDWPIAEARALSNGQLTLTSGGKR